MSPGSDGPHLDLSLSVMAQRFAVCRLEKSAQVPAWTSESSGFLSITRTEDELSIVCEERVVPNNVKAERGWKALKINGVPDFALTGVLSSILNPLTEAKIGVFAVSTYDTDYVLVKSERLEEAIKILGRIWQIEV